MATTTPNFGWTVPTSSDLVKNGATAIETLGDAIDASLVDLKGGTTGQVLTKASGTDMDFTWSAGASVPTSLGFAAGKNKIINGDFNIWQRGTSTTVTANTTAFVSDRWRLNVDNALGGSAVVSRQAFTPGTAPVAGYEGNYFLRVANTAGTLASRYFWQTIEDVQTFAGQTVTLSFFAKASSATSIDVKYQQNFGSGGSSAVNGTFNSGTSLTTSWQRFTYSITLPSISGKTIGTSSYVYVLFEWLNTVSTSIDIWGVQLEAGSSATSFQTATGTIQGELAACQRYYYRVENDATSSYVAMGTAATTTLAIVAVPLKTTMRVTPTAVDYSSIRLYDTASASIAITSATLQNGSPNTVTVGLGVASGLTQYRPYYLFGNVLPSYIGFTAEL